MKKQIRRVINIILAAVLLFAAAKFILSQRESYLSRQDYEQAMQIAGRQPSAETEPAETAAAPEATMSAAETAQDPEATDETAIAETTPVPEDPVIQELLAVDLDKLREENEDVIGWIYIPDTKINYPLLQWTDNEFYLEHTWKQKKNGSGSIFMECQNSPDFSEFNTIIYGHNMIDGSMFGNLHYYRRDQYRKEHPYIYILNDAGVLRFDIFAVQSANTESIIYGLGIETEQLKEQFIRFSLDYSYIDTGIIPTTEDRFLTLSTCTGAGHVNRMVVLSVLNEEASYKLPE